MKKYIEPSIRVYKIEIAHLLIAASNLEQQKAGAMFNNFSSDEVDEDQKDGNGNIFGL